MALAAALGLCHRARRPHSIRRICRRPIAGAQLRRGRRSRAPHATGECPRDRGLAVPWHMTGTAVRDRGTLRTGHATPGARSMSQIEKTRDQLIRELETLDGAWRRTQGELSEQKQLYRLLVENSLGLICSHDLDGVLLSINPAAAE